ncbi:SpvB/TcaC N-terminal domain-containing protein [Pseudomonas sp. NPDC089406]|uniref:SpvB/TcaC N-terminal domain-containing protein n=1 Tax=Pseudomonas sp. NPDC089406 TaxID=3364463 RepID=UPI00384FE274
MPEQMHALDSQHPRTPFYTAPSLPKGGGTVAIGAGMLSAGGPDGAAGWQLPLPSPAGRALSASLELHYSSSGGNSAFGAGWDCPLPAVARMTRFGFPNYDASDRLLGPTGEEILLAGPSRRVTGLPFSGGDLSYTVTPWRARLGSLAYRLEHWVAEGAAGEPGFWLHFLPDGSLSLYGWSAAARLHDPANPGHVAQWYLEETVSARGEHVVYRYRGEDGSGCSAQELADHPLVTHVYPQAVYAMNTMPSEALLIPQGAFREADFLTFTLFDYGERGADPSKPPALEPIQEWPVRKDCCSFWRLGFEVRLRRLCRDVLLWHRTARMQGLDDDTPELVSRLHLAYDSSEVASVLVSASQVTHDPATVMPPLEFELSRPGGVAPGWEQVAALEGFWSPAWQMVDLYGEGLPGLLYMDDSAWRYRAPQRQQPHNPRQPDAVTWGEPAVLPLRPGDASGALVDLDGDGRPEWLVTRNGLRGSFTLAPDGSWGGLVPLSALPAEFEHPLAQLVDLGGDGQQDVVLIGASGADSLRLYPAAGLKGWPTVVTRQYQGREPLPSLADGQHQLVTFNDPFGSGQSHLLRICGSGVTAWPSLGHGRFGEAISIAGFAVNDFSATRVLLADTDGAGSMDILYLQADGIRVFVSQCGNRYAEGPFIPAPPGVVLDSTCQLQVADLRGQGTADLLLTVPHGKSGNAPRSWSYRFNDTRPWLLSRITDNAGTCTLLEYRSSAQAWLDEKAEVLRRTGQVPVSYLPFPVHTLSRVTTLNQITGQCLGSQTSYAGGVWDGQEREFAGFTRLVRTDTHQRAGQSAAELSPPARTCMWFHSGVEAHDGQAQGAFTDMDQGFAAKPVRFTRWTDAGEQPFDPEPALRTWLYRGLRGQPMRSEVYGEDGQALAGVPYQVTRPRLQVRAYANADSQRPSALASVAETLTFACERIAQDPVVAQSLVLETDGYGNVLQSVDVHYPRQLSPQALSQEEGARRIYPEALPAGLIDASCDPQQYDCWARLTRTTLHNLDSGDDFVIGLPATVRTDAIHFSEAQVPEDGFSVEALLDVGLPLDEPERVTLAGFEKVIWRGVDGISVSPVPLRQALVAWTRTAMLDDASLDALRPGFEQTLGALVERALDDQVADLPLLTRLRRRLPDPPSAAALYQVIVAYLEAAPQDEAGCQALCGELERPAAQPAFWRALLWAVRQPGIWPGDLEAWLDSVRSALEGRLQEESLEALLARGGYIAMRRPADAQELSDPHDPEGLGAPGLPHSPVVEQVYAGHHGISLYQGEAHFWLPMSVQESTLMGPNQLRYSAHDITVHGVTDAAGIVLSVEAHDWRFLQPVRLVDGNDNVSEVTLDALGRVRHMRFFGSETPAGSDTPVMTGYHPDTLFEPPATVEQALALNEHKGVPVAEAFTVVADSWMPLALRADGSVEPERRCGELAWQRDVQRLRADGLVLEAVMAGRTPPHVIQVSTDRYDNDPQQQVRVQVTLTGGGQLLQAAILNPSGDALVRTEAGGLKTDDQGRAVIEPAPVRWAVSGKTEFDDKGQPVRTWLPFYLDDWRWVSDDSAREGTYADTYVYDALGRQTKVVRAAGEEVDGQWVHYEQRVQVYPWFTVAEDENDTWQQASEPVSSVN